MKNPSFNYFSSLPPDRYLLHWLGGFHADMDNSWHVRATVRGSRSGAFHQMTVPIGALPNLSPGSVFDGNRLSTLPSKGLIYNAVIPDLGDFKQVAIRDIPDGLYVFPDQVDASECLYVYETESGRLFLPTVELSRFLFLHNRILANAVMKPGMLEVLCGPHVPGLYDELILDFTGEIPPRVLTKEFVCEFAWLAVDPAARRAWDSIYLGACGMDVRALSPPTIQNSECLFRGVQFGPDWLVLQIVGLSGRRLPCQHLRFGHPSFRDRAGTKWADPQDFDESGGIDPKAHAENDVPSRPIYKVEIDGGNAANRAASGNAFIEVEPKLAIFENDVKVEKAYLPGEQRAIGKSRAAIRTRSQAQRETRHIRVGAGACVDGTELQGMEFKMLTPADWSTIGDLICLSSAIRAMARKLPRVEICMAPCLIKGGRVFSMADRERRHGLIVSIVPPTGFPIVLLDVQRFGQVKIALLAVRFRSSTGFENIEADVAMILDRLVERSGRWDRDLEAALVDRCSIERIPKLIDPRKDNPGDELIELWSEKLIDRLGLESERGITL